MMIGTRRRLEPWLRGAGDERADAGVSLVKSRGHEEETSATVSCQADGGAKSEGDAAFRELYYSHLGGFDQLWRSQPAAVHALDVLRPHEKVVGDRDDLSFLRGSNTLIELSIAGLKRHVSRIAEAVAAAGAGTRVTIK